MSAQPQRHDLRAVRAGHRAEPDRERRHEGQHRRDAGRHARRGLRARAERLPQSDAIAVATPAVLARRSGRRPSRSESSVATRTKHILNTPTATVAPRMAPFENMPAFRNTRGLYITTASMPDACWKKWIPSPDDADEHAPHARGRAAPSRRCRR
jgi:hypothetical protein